MKSVELADATAPLADYAEKVGQEPLILTDGNRPVAALVPIENTDLETASLSTNPQFLALIERSRVRYKAEGGVSGEEMRIQLGHPKPADN